MALPISLDTWPPDGWANTYDDYEEAAAWYSGDPNTLSSLYSSRLYTPTPEGRFWSKDMAETRRVILHLPIAGDIASTSADLLFSEHAQVSVDEGNEAVQARLDEIIDETYFHRRVLEAAETCAALGGVFLKVDWDPALSAFPLLNVVQLDNALPEFRYGLMSGVTFHQAVEAQDSGTVWRHLERHTPGLIENGLYQGTTTTLGGRVGLDAHSATAGLLDVVQTGLEGLAARYIPNMLPNRKYRQSAIGRGDAGGSETLLDSLDEVWTSLMRDIRLGQGRIIAPVQFFENDADGTKRFNVDKEVYLALHAPITGDSTATNQLTVNQFAIRTAEHLDAATSLIIQIVTNAGYSPQTFGLKVEAMPESGAALRIRERRSFVTAAKKSEYWRPALQDILEIMLQVDKLHLSGTLPAVRPTVEIQDSVQSDMMEIATSVELLTRAQSASVETKIRMLHPDWHDDHVDTEVEAILEETGMSVVNPDAVGIPADEPDDTEENISDE